MQSVIDDVPSCIDNDSEVSVLKSLIFYVSMFELETASWLNAIVIR